MNPPSLPARPAFPSRRWKFLAGALVLFGFAGASLKAKTAPLTPVELRCEYRENPLGVDGPQPRLGWLLNSTRPQLRDQRQTAYQVLVASSPALLAKDRGDLWDSGKVVSDAMNQLPYAGKLLSSYQSVSWKVRVWDQDGNPSAWSPAAQWTMGVLQPADWQGAKWIAAPVVSGKYETVLLRRGFTVKPGLKRALVYLCGLGQYELTLNGGNVGDAVMAPGWTAYDHADLYDSYDLTSSLHPGTNVLGVFLGHGFYNNLHQERYWWIGPGSFGPLQAIGLVRLEYADGTAENVVTDERWKTGSGPIVFDSIYGGEDYDARLEQPGWDRTGFDDSAWDQTVVTPGPGGSLRGLTAAAPPIRVQQVLKPVGKRQLSPNVAVYDLGQNAALQALLRVKGDSGATVKVTPSELVFDHGDINDRMCNGKSYCVYTLNGRGGETNRWKFYYRGGRYLRVETQPAPGQSALPEVTAVEGLVIRADAPVAGRFSCSSGLLNQIFNLIRWAQIGNMMSYMSDCPTREKFAYLEETHLNGPALRYNFDLSAFFTKTLNDIADAQRPGGLVPSRAPDYYHWAENFRFNTPIEWGSACILVPWQQYEFDGDTRMLANGYEIMKRYLDYLARGAQENIVSTGLGDWYDNLSEGDATLTPVALTDTAFYYNDYRVLAKIATVLGKSDEAAQFEQKAEAVRQAFNQKFFNPGNHTYGRGAQGSMCLPLVLDLAEPTNRAAILDNLLKDLQAKGTTAGEVSFRYLLRVLADAGRSDLIYTTYSVDTEGYGLQVKLGKTSLTEAWNGGTASQNHFMYGQLNEWFYHDLAGIQCDPAGPGFQKIIIKPALVGDLTWVKASYNSIRGDIVSEWTHGPDGLTMNVVIPIGATATLFVPAANQTLVKEGGQPAATRPGIKFLRMETGAAVFAAGSGTYQFSSADAAAAPSRLDAIAGNGTVALAWTRSVNARRYTIRRSTTWGRDYAILAANLTAMNYTDNTAINGMTYYYSVTAVNDLGESRGVEAQATPIGPFTGRLLINADIGSGPAQTGAAVLGSAGDVWNIITGPTGAIVDSAGQTLNDVGLTLARQGIFLNPNESVMDAATTPLMEDYAFSGTAAPVTVSLTGLTRYAGAHFKLVIYAAGDASAQGATLVLTAGATGGNSDHALNVNGASRQISAGAGVAYNTFTGTLTGGSLTFTAAQLPEQKYTAVNGFQLQLSPP